MFEDKNNTESDLLMRSILEGVQEEVPAHVWDKVAEGLDKASEGRTVVLWWRRAAVGFGVAAALAVGVVLNHGSDDELVPEAGENMIAVVERPETETVGSVMTAQVREKAMPEHIGRTAKVEVPVREIRMPADEGQVEAHEGQVETEPAAADVMPEEEKTADVRVTESSDNGRQESDLTYKYKDAYMPSEWEEKEERKERNVGTSFVLSGVAGTNGTNAGQGGGFRKQPSISTAPLKTGVKKTSTKSTYGIPLSFGAGVKIDFTEKWSLGVGVNYTLLTSRFYGIYRMVNEHGSEEVNIHSDIRNSQHFVGIPVNAFYNIVDSRHLNFYTYAGGTVEKCLKDRYQLLGKDMVHSEKVKGVQLSANIGIGVEFLIGRHLGLYIDPSLRYYFDTGQPSSIRTEQPLMLGLEMGLRVKL